MSHLWIVFLFLPLIKAQNLNGYYTVVAPRTIRPNLPYNVGVSVDANSPVSVVVSLKATLSSGGSSTSTQQSVIDPGSSQLITLQVGDLSDVGTYNLTVRGSDGLTFENTTELVFNPKSSTIIIQTDKPIYKPGELLQFRVLLLDRSFRPKGPGPLDIILKDSQNNVIKKWANAVAPRGMFSSELQLSKEPNFGDWTIQVAARNQKEIHSFLIAQYVLPKFNVEIDVPNFVTFNDTKTRIRVRANYVYGKPVKGEVVVFATPTLVSQYIQPVFSGIAQKAADIDGIADIEFDFTKELGLTDDFQRSVQLDVEVTEGLTGRKQNATKILTIHKYSYKMEIIKGSESFKPGIPYSITIKVATQDDVPISDPRPDALRIKHGFSYSHEEYESSTYSVPPNGLVTLTFQPPNNDSLHVLGIEAIYKELTEWFPTIQRALSPSNTYLKATLVSTNPKVNEEIEIAVEATAPFSTLNYDLIGRGDLLLSKKVNLPAPNNKLNFRILAPPNAAPRAKLVVYTVHENEIVADALEFHIQGSLDNFINVGLSSSQTEPGREVDIVITTKPNSIVGLKAIDQSVLVLKQDKDIDLKTIESEQNAWNLDPESRTRYKRSLFGHSGGSTASQVFEDAGVIIMTNAVVHQQPPVGVFNSSKAMPRPVRPFYDDAIYQSSSIRPDIGPAIPYRGPTRGPLAGPYAFSRIPRPRVNIPRIYFSDMKKFPAPTWIFVNASTGYDGRTSIRRAVPDTITSWIISGFSLDPVYGLGVMDAPLSLKVFRPFFISLNIPYSVIKGEAVGIQVVVHNYMNRDVTAEVTLDNSKTQFSFTQDENEIDTKLELFRTERVVVKSNSVNSVTFLITPTTLGPIDLHAKVASRLAGDEVIRPLLVRPPGQVQNLNTAALLDLRSGRSERVNLTTKFPPKRVPDSDFVKVSVVADILGPALTNLEKLLELPFGCGEQNLVLFVPDIVVLEYLQSSRQLTEAIRQKAINFLETGYQRELSFKHDDGSFSAFGKSDPTGSTWLTAFVVRAFIYGKPHIYIDKGIIENALEWLITQQAYNGSFPEVGKIFDTEMQGGSSQGLGLTAYVLMALLEADNDREITTSSRFSTAINLALDYVSKGLEGNEDPYAVALICYAMHLANHPLRDGAFNLLESLAKTSDDGQLKYWERAKTPFDLKNPWTANPRPLTVETTAYALLTYMQRNLIGDSIPVVRWLLEQRNEKGGFISTQDTVVGLAALARFARYTKSATTDMNIEITHEGGTQSVQINSNNAIVLQEITLPSTTRWVTVESTGTGMGIVQLSWGYNLEVTGAWPSFNLDPQVDRTSNSNQLHLSICTQFTGGNSSNMAVMEVNVPTGFAINTDRLPNLLHYPEIKRFDTDDTNSKLTVYFNELNISEVCPTVSAYRVFPVARQARSFVTVYDYYDNSRRARQFYSPPKTTICDICEETQCTQECLVARKQQQLEEEKEKSDKEPSSAMMPTPSLFTTALIMLIFVKLYY